MHKLTLGGLHKTEYLIDHGAVLGSVLLNRRRFLLVRVGCCDFLLERCESIVHDVEIRAQVLVAFDVDIGPQHIPQLAGLYRRVGRVLDAIDDLRVVGAAGAERALFNGVSAEALDRESVAEGGNLDVFAVLLQANDGFVVVHQHLAFR